MKQKTLKQSRRALGFTQVRMAEVLGVSVGTYGNWERRDRPFNFIQQTAIDLILSQYAHQVYHSTTWTGPKAIELSLRLGINQSELARLTGVTRQTVSLWSQGKGSPGIKPSLELDKLAQSISTEGK